MVIFRLSLLIFLLQLSFQAKALTPQCPDIAATDKANTLANIVGLATDPQSQQPLYCEYHYLPEGDANKVLVEYRDLEQNLIASKQLYYSGNLRQPEVLQQDFRNGERRAVSFKQSVDTQEADAAKIEVVYVKPESEKAKQAKLDFDAGLVIDAGFDAAIRQQWERLIKGESVAMDFLSPVHLRSFNLSVRLVAAEDCNIAQANASSELCFMIRPSNAFMNLIAKPLWLIYAKDSRRLLTYEGNVNLTTVEGDTLEANIRYYYR